MKHTEALGEKPVKRLLFEQAAPASVGILVLSIYGIVDTIFIGKWVGSLGIAAITVVIPITFLIASAGMAIGVGGASIISRALGVKDNDKAFKTFGNQIILTLSIALLFVTIGALFQDPFLKLFGGKGNILEPAKEYFEILLPGIPFLAFAMMSNNVIRSEGQAKLAMLIMLIPAVVNLILDPIFIIWLGWGLKGAAFATTFSYFCSAAYALWYFASGRSSIHPDYTLNKPIIREIFSLGVVTFSRQGTVSLLFIVLNNTLFKYGGELGVSTLGIVHRLSMFAFFPVLGITQGFLPIAGYNFGAGNWNRVKEVIRLALRYGILITLIIMVIIVGFSYQIVGVFTNDDALIKAAGPALIIAFAASPFAIVHLISSAYFQAIGHAFPALILTLLKQGFLMIPLLFILPPLFKSTGIWITFPIAEVGAAVIAFAYLQTKLKRLPTST